MNEWRVRWMDDYGWKNSQTDKAGASPLRISLIGKQFTPLVGYVS